MKIQRLITTLLTLFVLMGLTSPVYAEGGARGTSFFLLSDASYGSEENAFVRLETLDLGPVAEYGGVDVYVYRVNQPLAFLKAQKNLHRIDTVGSYAGPGLSNALSRIWDKWWAGSRNAWRHLFSDEARKAVTAHTPAVRSHPLKDAITPERLHPQYRPLKGHTLVERFRYPVERAKPIQPPKGVALAGSSSEFIQPRDGNVLIPLGKREPGLYLVEAMVGEHRAVTLVFVSNAIAVTKVSSKQMLVWVADRRTSQPVRAADTVWSDGVGVLASGATDGRGVVTFNRSAPEKTYIYGEDPQGGVFVAENFYYDSEIYNTKLYAVTDRPLYRPGETVYVKFLGRNFRSARASSAVAAGTLALQVFDANGFPVAAQTVKMSPQTGADTRFQLPDNAVAGGYELRFVFKGNAYGAAFRVAEYQKPHFEINMITAKRDFKTQEEVKGKLQLVYPDGKPVMNAKVELMVRAQRLTMIEGDLGYAGQFPLQLTTTSLVTDDKGLAVFSLPAAKEPSRYVLTALATDGAAYRVRVSKEILIERGAGTYTLKSERAFSAAGESVRFGIQPLINAPSAALPTSWEWVRLENRQRETGKVGKANALSVTFAEPGTYTLSLRDGAGNIVGATSHYVSGAGVGAPQGSIEMVFDKSQYKPGDTASALITFPQAVDQALFTLERDRVEKTALMAGPDSWVRVKKISPQQWRADIPVREDYGPNITFSVVYVKGGEYVFQNLGLKVAQARVAVTVRPSKPVYAPREKVTLDLTAMIGTRPAAGAQLTVSVVDEMIYVLQPEIAPDVFDFFYHPRRNNVRTSASLAFIGYDLAKPPVGAATPSRRQTNERAIKVLERPRREDKDTALWQPTVITDANGRARVSFVMPDSLTRWRVTVRAATPAGVVGQHVSHVRSDKDFYVKWTNPNWMRETDAPHASIAIFNQRKTDATVELTSLGAGLQRREKINVRPGANFLSLPLQMVAAPRAASAAQEQAVSPPRIDLALSLGGKPVDALSVPLKIVPLHWQSPRSLSVPLKGAETPFKLPADASNVRVQFADSASMHFRRVMDDLIEYPYGCVEQTSSRLIPYSLALQSILPTEDKLAVQLTQRLHSHRLRLAQMAGPKATFGWWSPPASDGDALLTAYAYYADWHASRALKIALPPQHFERLIEVYRTQGTQRSPWHRALMLHWMQEMGLPVRSLAEALAEQIAAAPLAPAARKSSSLTSVVLAGNDGELVAAMTRLLTAYVVQQTKGTVPPTLSASLGKAADQIRKAGQPLGESLLLMTRRLPAADASAVLEKVRAEQPTIDRSLTLLWTYRALGGTSASADTLLRASIAQVGMAAPWQPITTATGRRVFLWPTSQTRPATLKLTAAPAAGLTAVAQFDSRDSEVSSLPVQLTRRIYRLVHATSPTDKTPGNAAANDEPAAKNTDGENYALELVAPNVALKTGEVYLDEIALKRRSGAPLQFGIVEVPLPPGATADRTTWGISVHYPGGKAGEALERARYEQTPRGYAVPVDELSGDLTIRHLIRVAQTGRFALPPVRYYRMYQPEQKAFEEKARAIIEIR